MKIIKPEVLPEFLPDYFVLTTLIERAARTCYKSEGKIKPGSAEELIKSCIRRGHESVQFHITHGFIFDNMREERRDGRRENLLGAAGQRSAGGAGGAA